MLSAEWVRINGLLIRRKEVQQVLNLRYPTFTTRLHQVAMIERKKGQDYFIKLMINYGSLSDGMLRREIGRLDTELEFELDRAFTY